MDNSDVKREKINTLIEKENREQERTILMILRDFSDSAASSARMWKAIEDEHASRLDRHEELILKHDSQIEEHSDVVLRGKVTWYWLSVMFGGLSTAFAAAFIYGYTLIADIRDTVRDQQSIQDYLAKVQGVGINERNALVGIQSRKLDEVSKEIERIKKLRAVSGSK